MALLEQGLGRCVRHEGYGKVKVNSNIQILVFYGCGLLDSKLRRCHARRRRPRHFRTPEPCILQLCNRKKKRKQASLTKQVDDDDDDAHAHAHAYDGGGNGDDDGDGDDDDDDDDDGDDGDDDDNEYDDDDDDGDGDDDVDEFCWRCRTSRHSASCAAESGLHECLMQVLLACKTGGRIVWLHSAYQGSMTKQP